MLSPRGRRAPGEAAGAEQDIRASLEFWADPGSVLLLHLVTLPFLGAIVWGVRDPMRFGAWALGAAAYVVVVSRGWTPWRMRLFRRWRGLREGDDASGFPLRAQEFIDASERRLVAAGITATAVATPWVAYVATVVFRLHPIGPAAERPLAVWIFAVAGFLDAVRAGSLAQLWWSNDVLSHWSELARTEKADGSSV